MIVIFFLLFIYIFGCGVVGFELLGVYLGYNFCVCSKWGIWNGKEGGMCFELGEYYIMCVILLLGGRGGKCVLFFLVGCIYIYV